MAKEQNASASTDSEFETHIHKLVEQVARSPYRAAPEKRDALREIQRKNDVFLQIDDEGETFFRFEAIFGRIFTSIRSLQHIWTAALFFASLCGEREKASARGQTAIQIVWNPDIEVVRVQYELSCKMFKEKQLMLWPPDIGMLTPNARYLELADELFLAMCSFAILHEFAHFEGGHHKVSEVGVGGDSGRDERADEFAADKWAYDWILSSWKDHGDDPKIFTNRALGVIFTLAMADEFRYLALDDSFSTHPRPVDRLIQFYDDYEKEIRENGAERACFNAITIGLQMIAFNNKNLLLQGPYRDAREFLDAVKASQQKPPQNP